MEAKKTAFIIMPFDVELEEVYDGFIKPVLEEVGFSVRRADDLFNQRNILRDIVESIAHSDLVVVDLTNLNPNVFYELGVAHALRRPVVLLTQRIDEVPFDLKSYRLVAYETHFARIDEARATLATTARGALLGTIEFGNPVSDFLVGAGQALAPISTAGALDQEQVPSEVNDDTGGWLDHAAALEEGFEKLTEILNRVTAATTEMGGQATKYAERIDNAKKSSESGRMGRLRFISHEYGGLLTGYAVQLRSANDEYEQSSAKTQDSLEYLISRSELPSPESERQLREFVEMLRGVGTAAGSAREQFSTLRGTVDALAVAEIEKRLTKGSRLVTRELDRFVSNTDLTIAAVQRGIDIGERRLGRRHP